MGSMRSRVKVEVELDCGCWVEKGVESIHGMDGIEKTIHLAADILPHHLDRAEAGHKCDLVTEANPNGDSRSN